MGSSKDDDDDDDDKKPNNDGGDTDEWNFAETIKPSQKPVGVNKVDSARSVDPKAAAPKPTQTQPTPTPAKGAPAPAQTARPKAAPAGQSSSSLTTSTGSAAPAGAAPPNALAAAPKPTVLTSVLYPVLGKLLKQYKDQQVVAALAQLKIAFDNAEKAQPGISHQIVAQIIEAIKTNK